MAKPVCRIGDQVTGTCSAVSGSGSGHPRPFTGTWQTGSSVGKADGIAIVRVGDTGLTDCGHTFVATEGSNVMNENDVKVHRVDDAVEVIGGGNGVSVTGSPTCEAD